MSLRKHFSGLFVCVLVFIVFSIVVLLPVFRQTLLDHRIYTEMAKLQYRLAHFVRSNEVILNLLDHSDLMHLDLDRWDEELEELHEQINAFSEGILMQRGFPQRVAASIDALWRNLHGHFVDVYGDIRGMHDEMYAAVEAIRQGEISESAAEKRGIQRAHHIYVSLQAGHSLLQVFQDLQLPHAERMLIEHTQETLRVATILRASIAIALGVLCAVFFGIYYRGITRQMHAERRLIRMMSDSKDTGLLKGDELSSLHDRISALHGQHSNLLGSLRAFLSDFRTHHEGITDQKIKNQFTIRKIDQNIRGTKEFASMTQEFLQHITVFNEFRSVTMNVFTKAVSEWNAIKARTRALAHDLKRRSGVVADIYARAIQDKNSSKEFFQVRSGHIRDLQQKLSLSIQEMENVQHMVDEMNAFADRAVVLSMNMTLDRSQREASEKAVSNISGEMRKLGSETRTTLKTFHTALKTMHGNLQEMHNILHHNMEGAEGSHKDVVDLHRTVRRIHVFFKHTQSTHHEFYECIDAVDGFFAGLPQQVQEASKTFDATSNDISAKLREFASAGTAFEDIGDLLADLQRSEDTLQDIVLRLDQAVGRLRDDAQFDERVDTQQR